jgi:hypothetical protein
MLPRCLHTFIFLRYFIGRKLTISILSFPSTDMAAADVQQPPSSTPDAAPEAAPVFPDFFLTPDAVLKDDAAWRFGKAPDYSNTRRVFAESKSSSGDLITLAKSGYLQVLMYSQENEPCQWQPRTHGSEPCQKLGD